MEQFVSALAQAASHTKKRTIFYSLKVYFEYNSDTVVIIDQLKISKAYPKEIPRAMRAPSY